MRLGRQNTKDNKQKYKQNTKEHTEKYKKGVPWGPSGHTLWAPPLDVPSGALSRHALLARPSGALISLWGTYLYTPFLGWITL